MEIHHSFFVFAAVAGSASRPLLSPTTAAAPAARAAQTQDGTNKVNKPCHTMATAPSAPIAHVI